MVPVMPRDVLDRFTLTHSNLRSHLRLMHVFLAVSVLKVSGVRSKEVSRTFTRNQKSLSFPTLNLGEE